MLPLLFSGLLCLATLAAGSHAEPTVEPNSLLPHAAAPDLQSELTRGQPGAVSGSAQPRSLTAAEPSNIRVEEAARIVRRYTGGRVLSTTRVLRQGEGAVRVRVLVDGSRVSTLLVLDDGRVIER